MWFDDEEGKAEENFGDFMDVEGGDAGPGGLGKRAGRLGAAAGQNICKWKRK